MNDKITKLYDEYMHVASNPVAAAILVLADMRDAPTPDPIIVEPEECTSYDVKATAKRLGVTSKTIYKLILAGQLHSFRVGRSVRISISEIDRYEARTQPPRTNLVPIEDRL
ncbi:MAG: helix-turn-helix domain-containing protein [Thermoguttaceae bacterium]